MPHNTGHVYAFQPSENLRSDNACQHVSTAFVLMQTSRQQQVDVIKGFAFSALLRRFPRLRRWMYIKQASKQASKQTSKKHIILAARRKDRNTQAVLLWCMRDLRVGLANCWWHWALKFSKLQSSVGGISQKPCHYFDVTQHRGTPPYACVDSPECSNAICQLVVEGATSVVVGS